MAGVERDLDVMLLASPEAHAQIAPDLQKTHLTVSRNVPVNP